MRYCVKLGTFPVLKQVMARSSQIPASEQEIGRRLRAAREKRLISQTAFALAAGIGRERLASYEHGYVPLPWTVGDQICRKFDLNARWLVEGNGPDIPYFRPLEVDTSEIGPRALFSEVYAKWFRSFYELRMTRESIARALSRLAGEPAPDRRTTAPKLRNELLRLEALVSSLPLDQQWDVFDEITRLLGRVVIHYIEESRSFADPIGGHEQ